MRQVIDTIKGRIVDYNPKTQELTIKAVYTDWKLMVKRQYKEVSIQMIDDRPISDKQRRTCYKLLKEIAKHTGMGLDPTKEWTKHKFVTEELNQPVIVQFAGVHEQYVTLDVIGPVMVMLAEQAKVPVCVHLDHGEEFDFLKKALDMGFSSVMYDGSLLPFEQNVANTRIAVEIADGYGASVEAEIGAMGDDGKTDADKYTDPDEAKRFVDATGVDALACSFGTIHGLYTAAPKLDFGRIRDIREKIGIPVVMHGGSGVSEADMKECIRQGVRKINYYTYAAKAAGAAVKAHCLTAGEGNVFFHDIAVCARAAIREDVLTAMKVFQNR